MQGLPDSIQVFERGWLSSNNILLIGRHDTALIDSGYLTHAPQTLALVRHALHGRHLDRLINTHLHSDHCGGNAILQAHYGCDTAIPAAEADKVRHWDVDALSFKATGQQCERFSFDSTVSCGDVLTLADMEWRALGAPGHDPHSLIFYCPEHRVLASADALWENGFGVIFPELDGESGFAEERATLDLIEGLDVRLVIPGHGAPFTDVQGALARARSRVDYLEADPVRNAQNAIKVLLKFLLLERQRIALADVPQMLLSMPVFATANARYLRQTPDELAQWAVGQLVKGGAAHVESEYLLND
ncbi:MBL fold metallo-hydrolase [Duganella sp. LX20W]|uniref:beta-lactamase n=1 Tax=Rugamonas brunnea TaxID=2758569 RepID=A0A7W2EQ95_9BURK|nr:MBL fold metallo-hydrolase [Rugamonas brunnea]MBA5636670.1 MBL fold metallo-hydrolase [Rugamonas brunnea]